MLRRSAASTDLALCAASPDGLASHVAAFEVAVAAMRDGSPMHPSPWIQLTPRGQVTARDGRSFFFDPEKLAAAFTAGGVKLPIDFDHETEHVETLGAKPARAWIVGVEARPEGLFGNIEWLKDAVEALAAKAYRYISPTFFLEKDGKSARYLKSAALVTSPALGMPALASAQTTTETRPMKALLAKLGLTENATEDEAIAKLSALTPDATKFVPVAQYEAANAALVAAQATITATEDAAKAAKCAALVDKGVADGKIAPAAKDHYMALAAAAFEDTEKAIAAMPKLVAGGEEDPAAKAAAEGGQDGALTPAELAMCAATGVTPEAFKAAKAT